jgi:SPP1 gp7 family putative phage head morphogenesis protein
MTQVINRRLGELERAIEELLFPVLEEVAIPEELPLFRITSEPRFDAPIPIDHVRRRLGLIELRLAAIFDPDELSEELEKFAKRVQTKNRNELRRVVGIAVGSADPGVAALVDRFREQNVARITSLAGQELVEITELLEEAGATGLRVEQLRKRIQERFGVTKSKAALLARDQTLTLNAQIARQRQQNLGIQEYVWTTSGDGRVRDTHAELDGTIQRWDNPPEISEDGRRGHPGDDYQCRCTAYPRLPELA